ncbi:hypothetical protein ScalyP_jg8467 [Parmales sp. scaly parma]|nr:hypothetical protein ScalyP_jg8467 [Parmales sp. scaly parma]
MKGVFVGSGSEGLQNQEVCDSILYLCEKGDTTQINVIYVGTATYDLDSPMVNQTIRLKEAGCNIIKLSVTEPDKRPSFSELEKLVTEVADIIIISGGNTLFAIDVWRACRLDELFRIASSSAGKGCVFAGGSFGANCWFTGAHSDSWDPESYKTTMLEAFEKSQGGNSSTKDEASEAPKDPSAAKPWRYIRVSCLNFLPGLVCAHFDRIQSNGVLRADDFDKMMKRHPREQGIGIDHWAALVVDGNDYTVLSMSNKPGSVKEDGTFCRNRSGAPGIWLSNVNPTECEVEMKLLPNAGMLSDFLKHDFVVVEDEGCETCRLENPSREEVNVSFS